MRADGGAGTTEVALTADTVLLKETKIAAGDLKPGDAVFGRGERVDGALRVRTLQVQEGGAAVKPGGAGTKPGGFAAKPGGGGQGGGAGNRGGGQGDGAANRDGTPGPGPGGAALIAGTVARVDGSSLVLTTAGGEVTATLASDAELQRTAPAGREELRPGAAVTVANGGDGDGGRSVVTIRAA